MSCLRHERGLFDANADAGTRPSTRICDTQAIIKDQNMRQPAKGLALTTETPGDIIRCTGSLPACACVSVLFVCVHACMPVYICSLYLLRMSGCMLNAFLRFALNGQCGMSPGQNLLFAIISFTSKDRKSKCCRYFVINNIIFYVIILIFFNL